MPPLDLQAADPEVRRQYEAIRQGLESRLLGEAAPDPEVGTGFGYLGMWHDVYDYPELAERCFLEAEQLSPEDASWPYYLGHLLGRKGRARAAERAFQRVLALEPDNVPALVFWAELLIDAGQLERADQLLAEAQTVSSYEPRISVRRAQIALQRNDPATAVELLEPVVRRTPGLLAAEQTLAVAYRTQGRGKDAILHFSNAARTHTTRMRLPLTDPRLSRLRSIKGGARRYDSEGQRAHRAGRYQDAIQLFKKAVAAAPSFLPPRFNLASTLAQAGRASEARVELQLLLEHDPTFADAHFLLSRISDGSPEQRERYLRTTLEHDPGHKGAHETLARVLEARGDFDEAASHHRAAALRAPNAREARTLEVMARVRAGDHLTAKALLDEALEDWPSALNLLMLQARLIAISDEPSVASAGLAIELARQLVEQQPTLAAVETAAMAYAAANDFTRARAWQRSALEAVRAAGREGELGWVGQRLELYEAQERPKVPWTETERRAQTAALTPDTSGLLN